MYLYYMYMYLSAYLCISIHMIYGIYMIPYYTRFYPSHGHIVPSAHLEESRVDAKLRDGLSTG